MQQRFFSSPGAKITDEWQVIHSGYSNSLLFYAPTNVLVGLGSPMDPFSLNQQAPWQILLKSKVKVKQVAAQSDHILVLYEHGILEGYGRSACGELGIGMYSKYVLNPVRIELPDGATPVFIAAGKSCSFVIGDNQSLYGFGSNDRLQLGLPEKEEFLPFPTKIPLPADCIPQQVFSNHFVTVVIGKNNVIYGFGAQSRYHFGYEGGKNLEIAPLRLKHFEAHFPP